MVQQRAAKTSPESAAGLYVIPTCQRSDIDLVRTGEVVENEKDRLLERVSVSWHCCAVMPLETGGCRPLECCMPHSKCPHQRHILQDTSALCLLPQFCEFAKAACDALIAKGYWADYIDPCSGLPVRSLQRTYD